MEVAQDSKRMERAKTANASLSESLCDSQRPSFVFGCTPPREGTSESNASDSCRKFASRSAVLATDGFIVYDIQDEAGRTTLARPFPFRKTLDPSWYASLFPMHSGKGCIVYKCVVEDDREAFIHWLDEAINHHGHCAFTLVGAPTSAAAGGGGITLQQAAQILTDKAKEKSLITPKFGCVAIAERHSKKGTEHRNMLRKMNLGAQWFITQGIYSSQPTIQLLRDYADLCREQGLRPKKVVLTFAPCGRHKTMKFIKWLGMDVPAHVEDRIFSATTHPPGEATAATTKGDRDLGPVQESCRILCETLVSVLEATTGIGVPLGVNVESLSIFKEEIEASHSLFRSLQEIMLNHTGRPWIITWSFAASNQDHEDTNHEDDQKLISA